MEGNQEVKSAENSKDGKRKKRRNRKNKKTVQDETAKKYDAQKLSEESTDKSGPENIPGQTSSK